jgi:Secretion system C-terminal sorting domain
MKKIFIIVLLAYLSHCIAQEFRGGELHFVRIDQYRYDTDIDLYYQKPNIPIKNFIVIDESTGIRDTAYLVTNDSISPKMQRLRYYTRLFLPFEEQTYIIHVLDTFFCRIWQIWKERTNLFFLGAYLTPPYTQFFDLNSPPVFAHPPTDYTFNNGKLIFDSGAVDPDGDTLFYELINPNYPDLYDYTWPASSDSFFLNPLNGVLTWDKPLYPGKYLIGVAVAEYNIIAHYFGQMWRYFIIEITEADLVSIQDQTNAFGAPFLLSPNPASNELLISKQPRDSRFEIIDLIGNVMQSGSLGEGTQMLNILSLHSGIYLVRVFLEGRVWTEKLVVQR